MAVEESITPYSTVAPYLGDLPAWVPETEQERVASYLKYDDMYWSRPESFKLALVDEDAGPIYVPKAMTVVDTTAHYLLKGLSVTAPQRNAGMMAALDAFMKRETFFSKFHVAKHSGVTRGDYLIHITADKNKPEGRRISINTVHPAAYFPVYDEWDPEKLLRVHLAEQFERKDEAGRIRIFIRRLTYEYEYRANATRRVWRQEGFFEEKDWFHPAKAEQSRALLKREMLPEEIDTIPLYHFKNKEWQGEDYGSSELRGFERLLQGINQTITDEEVALALEGLGVYATDASGPVDLETGARIPWRIAPARVLEVPLGSYFKRVEGIGTITPMLDHVKYLVEALFEASGTTDVARGAIDAQVAQSGIALAIKFLPTLAKIEQRDQAGIDKLTQFWYDWKKWHAVFEEDLGDGDITVAIGDKLPQDKTARLNELNNMYDRGLIPGNFYRAEMAKLGYVFPDDIEEQLAKEADEKFKRAQELASLNQPQDGGTPGAGKSGVDGRPPAGQERQNTGNKSRNKNRPNESGGTEAQ
jgi:hypothetical protein